MPTQISYRNIFLLSAAWCFGFAGFFMQVTTTSARAAQLKGTVGSTVPLGSMLLMTWMGGVLVPKAIAAFGHKKTFLAAGVFGTLGAVVCLISTVAVKDENLAFALLVIGSMPQGLAHAATNNYRFAVRVFSPPELVPKAISYVIAGGSFSALIGPEASKHTKDLVSTEFGGNYILLSGVWACLTISVGLVIFPPMPKEAPDAKPGRPTSYFLSQHLFVYTLAASTMTYGAMGALMAATPVSMRKQGHDFYTSTTAVELHIVGMFLPSIFTGDVIKTIGLLQTVTLGFATLLGGALLFYISDQNAAVYMIGITIIGVGWNWSFVSLSSLLLKQHLPSESSTVQSITDGIVIGGLAIMVFTVGFLFKGVGEEWFAFVGIYIAVALIGLVWTLYVWSMGIMESGLKQSMGTLTTPSQPASGHLESNDVEASGSDLKPVYVAGAVSPPVFYRQVMTAAQPVGFMSPVLPASVHGQPTIAPAVPPVADGSNLYMFHNDRTPMVRWHGPSDQGSQGAPSQILTGVA